MGKVSGGWKWAVGGRIDFRPLPSRSLHAALLTALFLLAGCAASPSPPQSDTLPSPHPTDPEILASGNSADRPTPSATPGPAATPTPVFEPVSEADWATGPADAPITLVAYCDFQSRGCAGLAATLDRLTADHPGSIRRVFRHFPLALENDKSVLAAEAAQTAGAQGKFWELHDRLFARQAEWIGLTPDEFRSYLDGLAPDAGLDLTRFSAELDHHRYLSEVDRQYQAASAGVPWAPFLLFNGQPYGGVPEHWALEQLVQLELLKDRQYAAYPPMILTSGTQYTATLHTSKGEITFELYPEQAPLAVNSFIFLAREGWYDRTTFHHVLRGSLARGGDPTGTGLGGPGYTFPNETGPGLTFDRPGVVAAFNVGPATNGSQFFITASAQPNLTGNYTIFGRVTAGLNVLDGLTERNPDLNPYAPPGDLISSVTIQER